MYVCGAKGRVEEPPTPPYPYKYKQLPIMKSYHGILDDKYWSLWEKNPYSPKPNNWIRWSDLKREAEAVEYGQVHKLIKAEKILLEGAELGCKGNGRLPSKVENSPTVPINGSKVADTLMDWVTSKIVHGPFTKEELPFPEVKISPLGVQPKPGGKIRLVLDLSAPHGVDKNSTLPNSVNMGIDSEELSTNMSSLKQVCERIWKFGYPAEFCKSDYNSAYKHVAVKHEDRHLQVFEFCGRYFIESQLTFGSKSSPDRFDLISDIPLEIALIKSDMWRDDAIKQLDDACGFGTKGTGAVQRFYDNYRMVCGNIGVSLASESDPEKAFGPSTKGVILGVEFNLEDMTWRMSSKKADRLLALLWKVVDEGMASLKTVQSLCGKLNHYAVLTKFGKWERSWILGLLIEGGSNPSKMLIISGLVKQQLEWWIRAVELAKIGTKIPDPRTFTPRVYVEMFPDAAGGLGPVESGLGSWFPTGNSHPWIQVPWPELIQTNGRNSLGTNFARKLTTLEGAAALMGLVSEPDLIRNKNVVIFTDNAGLTFAYEKGHSKCPYANTIAKAINYMGKALNATVWVQKTPRRSNLGEIVADELSKGNLEVAMSKMGDPAGEQSFKSKVLLKWLEDPYPSRTLGEQIADEIAIFTPILDWGQF